MTTWTSCEWELVNAGLFVYCRVNYEGTVREIEHLSSAKFNQIQSSKTILAFELIKYKFMVNMTISNILI